MAKKEDIIEYMDTNVYEQALKRVEKIYNSHDEVWVNFSGGKDSLVMLKLVEEYHEINGYSDKINVIFRDEEMINTFVRDFVLTFVDNPKYNFKYYTTQLVSEIFVLGAKRKYIQWDENRRWVIDKPECGITEKGVYDQYNFNQLVFDKRNKRVCNLVGIRADESLMRYSGISKSRIPYLTKDPTLKNGTIGKPIYDWSEKDIFKYLHDKEIDYCQIYDMQIFNKESLRVATILHAEASRNLYKVKTLDPILYNQVVDIFPDIELQARYHKDIAKSGKERIIKAFKEKSGGDPWGAILLYIEENLTDPTQKRKALHRVYSAKKTRDRKKLTPENPFGGYPAHYIFNKIIGGGYKRPIQPISDAKDIYFEYENRSLRA